MKAVVYTGEGRVSLEDRPRPEILEPTDAILKVTAAGICGTDLHLVEGKVPGFEEGTVPHVLRLDDAVEAYEMFRSRAATKIVLTA
jgi:threonine dehydrogenase-like Zn-dependent dehydrogenase